MIKLMANKNRGGEVDTSDYSFAATEKIRALHESLDAYSETPLLELKNFAAEKNIRALYVKDESKRFGLKAFKGLGGVWAIYKVISNELGLDNPTLAEIFTHRAELDAMTFITTTDGNHGKGVSWAAGLFGCKSFVYMPRGTVEVRAQAIRDAGSAQVQITDMNYDDCVKFTARLAQENHWHLIQDTSWAGYEEIPAQIMLGYSTLAYEALRQMNYLRPTHIFLQAGVGSMAGAIAAVFAEVFKENPPRVTIVEPTEVACFYETMRIGDGKIYSATGNGRTMMAGLNCATPCELAWKILRRYSADTATISDDVAAEGMRVLAANKIISGESGCAGFALANAALNSEELRGALELDEDSIIFVVNTEGDTDPDNYVRAVRCQLSAFSFQLSAFSFQLSAFSFQDF
ncbi:MAG: diaminopropionate ammonia-lyase [Selenomonadaceae bacterium]|nr:diaminopropionate ammonia-lyase [Selenomonadaceae bacterium]